VITDDDLAEIARIFALGDGATFTGMVARGEQGEVAQVATARGIWALKTSFDTSMELDGEDAEFQTAARAVGVPAPAVVRKVDGDSSAALGALQVRMYEWVDLRPQDRHLDPADVGRLLAAIHGVRFVGRRPEDPWYTQPVGRRRWEGLADELTTAGAPFATDLAAMLDELIALEDLIQPAGDVRTCHRDLWAENLRRTVSGALCVIDWDNCGLADPGQEVAVALFEFSSGDADRARAFYHEYRRCGGPGRVQGPGDFSMAIAQLGHITELSCRRWLDRATSQTERDRQAARFVEGASDPLTRRVIDELLEAILA
jgi:hypothetical protein